MGLVEFTVFKFGFCCSWQKRDTRELFEHFSIRSKSCPTNRWQGKNVKIYREKNPEKKIETYLLLLILCAFKVKQRSLFTKILWRRHAYTVKQNVLSHGWPLCHWGHLLSVRVDSHHSEDATLDAADEWTLCFFPGSNWLILVCTFFVWDVLIFIFSNYCSVCLLISFVHHLFSLLCSTWWWWKNTQKKRKKKQFKNATGLSLSSSCTP